MGGYAVYVWTSYGLALVVLALNVLLPRRAERAALAALARRRELGTIDDAQA
ncbi:MAG: heme exporter protein CcmD [Gammaproteobacteria bacterium]|nr:heme exporter protein CcmD [Gammaproteobacteria bacterium]